MTKSQYAPLEVLIYLVASGSLEQNESNKITSQIWEEIEKAGLFDKTKLDKIKQADDPLLELNVNLLEIIERNPDNIPKNLSELVSQYESMLASKSRLAESVVGIDKLSNSRINLIKNLMEKYGVSNETAKYLSDLIVISPTVQSAINLLDTINSDEDPLSIAKEILEKRSEVEALSNATKINSLDVIRALSGKDPKNIISTTISELVPILKSLERQISLYDISPDKRTQIFQTVQIILPTTMYLGEKLTPKVAVQVSNKLLELVSQVPGLAELNKLTANLTYSKSFVSEQRAKLIIEIINEPALCEEDPLSPPEYQPNSTHTRNKKDSLKTLDEAKSTIKNIEEITTFAKANPELVAIMIGAPLIAGTIITLETGALTALHHYGYFDRFESLMASYRLSSPEFAKFSSSLDFGFQNLSRLVPSWISPPLKYMQFWMKSHIATNDFIFNYAPSQIKNYLIKNLFNPLKSAAIWSLEGLLGTFSGLVNIIIAIALSIPIIIALLLYIINNSSMVVPPNLIKSSFGETTVGGGNKQCKVLEGGACSVSNLERTFGNQTENAAQICLKESGGDESALNNSCLRFCNENEKVRGNTPETPSSNGTIRIDMCTKIGRHTGDYSAGLFQTNILCSSYSPPGYGGKKCHEAFSNYRDFCSLGLYGNECFVTDWKLLADCVEYFWQPENSISYSDRQSSCNDSDPATRGWQPWTTSVSCNIPSNCK
jgi:hypothetical protein